MKNRTDKILLTVFLLSLPAYALILLTYLEIIPVDFPPELFSLRAWFALTFGAVPAFCLQLLLCRRIRGWFAATPVLTLLGMTLFFTLGWLTATGWAGLGWGLLMILSIAPAVGCVLAWVAYGLHKLHKRGDARG